MASRAKATREKEVKRGLEEIIKDGGEGIVLRRPRSAYVQGRSELLVKLKVC